MILGTAAFFFIAMQVIASLPSLGMYGAADELYNDPIFFFSFIAATVGAMVLPLALKYYSFNYRPKMSELMYVHAHCSGLSLIGPYELRNSPQSTPREMEQGVRVSISNLAPPSRQRETSKHSDAPLLSPGTDDDSP